LFVFLSGPEGTIRLVQMMMERAQLRREIQDLERENTTLVKTIQRFRNDPEAVEEEAREHLGLVRKGEVIYRFAPKDTKTRP